MKKLLAEPVIKGDTLVYTGKNRYHLNQEALDMLLETHENYVCIKLGLDKEMKPKQIKKAKKVRIENAYICELKINSRVLNYLEFVNCIIVYINFDRSKDLKSAKFTHCSLIHCNFISTEFSHANFKSSEFIDCLFKNCNLGYINLTDVRITNTLFDFCFPEHTVIGITCIGSRTDTTLYFIKKDRIFCGCWNGAKGGSLEEFKKRVETEYGEKSPKGPTKRSKTYYAEYMNAIKFFEAERKLYAK
jgi:hypothetical protein